MSLGSYKKVVVNDSSECTMLYIVQLFSNMKCLSDNLSIIMNNFPNPYSSLTAVMCSLHVPDVISTSSSSHSDTVN